MKTMNVCKIVVLMAPLLLAGCSLFGSKDDESSANTEAFDPSTTSGYAGGDTPPPVEIGGGAGANGAAGRTSSGNVIYFEYDSVEVSAASREIIANQARHLAANPAAKVRLEGHADERGTREYNVGLAERRAYAVMQSLLAQGATAGQMSVISYGEERPASSGHDDSAWALNRRVEIIR